MTAPYPQPARQPMPALDRDAVLWQRAEGAVLLVGAVVAYEWLDASWWLFALLLLAPDLAMLAYLRSAAAGTVTYNLVHNLVGPGMLALASLAAGPLLLGLAAIWVAHIGMDRMLGYGLKYRSDFRQTHLGLAGKAR